MIPSHPFHILCIVLLSCVYLCYFMCIVFAMCVLLSDII